MEKITGQDLTGARNNLCNEKLMFLTVPQKKKKLYFHQIVYPYHTTVISKWFDGESSCSKQWKHLDLFW